MRGLACSTLIVLCAAVWAQETTVVHSLDLRSMVEPGARGEPALFKPPCGGRVLIESDPEVVEPVPQALLLRLLQGVAGESMVQLVDGKVILAGEPGAVARATTLAEGLQQSLGRPVVLQAWWIDPGTVPPAVSALLGAEEAEALRREFKPGGSMRLIGEARLQVLPGGASGWDRVETFDRIARYEVEVANKAAITHPMIEPLMAGERLRLRVAPAPGGRLALFFEAWQVLSPQVRKVVVGNPRVPWVEPSSAKGMLVAGSALLGRGEALLVQQQDGDGASWLMIQLQEAPAPMEGLVYLGPLFLPWHRFLSEPVPFLHEMEFFERGWGTVTWERESPSETITVELFDRLAGAMGLVPRAVLPAGALLTGGGWRPDRFQRLAAGLGLDRERVVQVELLVKGVPKAQAEGMYAEAILRQAQLLQHLVFPVLTGRQGLFLAGREAEYLASYEVEIAQKSAQATPVFSSAWSGLSGLIDMEKTGPRLSMRHHWAGEPRRVATEAKDLGPVERVVRRRAVLSGEWPADGRLQLLGEGATQGEGEGLWRVAVGLMAR